MTRVPPLAGLVLAAVLWGCARTAGWRSRWACSNPGWPICWTSSDLCILGGTVSAAGYSIIARRVEENCDALGLTADQFTVAALAVLPVTLGAWATGAEPFPMGVDARLWGTAVLLGVAGFAVSFCLYNAAIRTVEAGTAAIVPGRVSGRASARSRTRRRRR